MTLDRARLTGTYRSHSIAPDGSVSSQVGLAIGGVQVVWAAASRVLPDLNASALTGWWARLSSLCTAEPRLEGNVATGGARGRGPSFAFIVWLPIVGDCVLQNVPAATMHASIGDTAGVRPP